MLYACNTFNVSIILILSEKHQGAIGNKLILSFHLIQKRKLLVKLLNI